jgi:hypothetical protein
MTLPSGPRSLIPRIYLAILTPKSRSYESIGERVHNVSPHGGARAMENVGAKAWGSTYESHRVVGSVRNEAAPSGGAIFLQLCARAR